VVVAAGSRFREECGDNGKLIDVEASPDGGWSRRSSMRWPWKRWWAAWRLEPARRKKQHYEGEEEKQVNLASSTMSRRGIRTQAVHAASRGRAWATGNRVRTIKLLLRLTSGPGFIL
jgi:hypothetical protein